MNLLGIAVALLGASQIITLVILHKTRRTMRQIVTSFIMVTEITSETISQVIDLSQINTEGISQLIDEAQFLRTALQILERKDN